MARTLRNRPAETADFPPKNLFAQPLPQPEQNGVPRSLRSGLGLAFLPGLMCAALVAIAQTDAARRWEAEGRIQRPFRAGAETPQIRVAQNDAEEDVPEEEPSLTPSRRPLDFYTGEVRGNLFSAPIPPAPKPAPKPKIVVPIVKPAPPAPPVIINPFATWVYSGTIKMGDTLVALVENTQTGGGGPREGHYVRAGETVMGAQVTTVTDQQVTLMSGGKTYTLAKSADINATPLSANAPGVNPTPGQPGQPQPGQPGMPQMAVPMGAPTGNTVILPNGAVMNERDAARRQRFMDRNFRRGQNGGGPGGRGGNPGN